MNALDKGGGWKAFNSFSKDHLLESIGKHIVNMVKGGTFISQSKV